MTIFKAVSKPEKFSSTVLLFGIEKLITENLHLNLYNQYVITERADECEREKWRWRALQQHVEFELE